MYEYKSKKEDYSKAMGWYQLAVNQNYTDPYNEFGFMYDHELGVSRDYFTAMECYLKTARDNHKLAMSNIALLFLNGCGVPTDKYKALERFIKCDQRPEKEKKLNQEGIYLTEKDISRPFYEFELCY